MEAVITVIDKDMAIIMATMVVMVTIFTQDIIMAITIIDFQGLTGVAVHIMIQIGLILITEVGEAEEAIAEVEDKFIRIQQKKSQKMALFLFTIKLGLVK